MQDKISMQNQILRCLIVDDEPIAIKGITNFVKQVDFLEIVDTCTSAMQAAMILKTNQIDLMFLDINMPMLTGIDFLESLEKPPLTILTTAYSEHALDGYRLNVVDYLLKPIEFQRFFQAVNKAQSLFQSQVELYENKDESTMYIRQGDTYHRINWEDILYVEGMQNYLKIHFKDITYVIHQTMTSLEELLPKDSFFRVHISYLINIHKLESISAGKVTVADKQLPLSRHRKEELLQNVVYKRLISK